jgi:hypothetical protein
VKHMHVSIRPDRMSSSGDIDRLPWKMSPESLNVRRTTRMVGEQGRIRNAQRSCGKPRTKSASPEAT